MAMVGWLVVGVACSLYAFQYYASRHDQLESALGTFIALLTPVLIVLLLLGLWRLGRMRFPH
jgi:hypothetical protein